MERPCIGNACRSCASFPEPGSSGGRSSLHPSSVDVDSELILLNGEALREWLQKTITRQFESLDQRTGAAQFVLRKGD